MTHPKLIILSTSEAALLLGSKQGEIDAAISIIGAREADLPYTLSRHLGLSFDDAIEPDLGTVTGLMEKSRRERQQVVDNTPIPKPPCRDDVHKIIKFARDNGASIRSMLIHCAGGISRSPAAGIVCLVAWGVSPGDAVQQVCRVRPAAQPHHGIIAIGDELLGLEGRLIKAAS